MIAEYEGESVMDALLNVAVMESVLTVVIVCVRVRRSVRVEVLVTKSVIVTLVVTVLEIQGERLVVVLRDGVFDPMLCVSVRVVCKDCEMTGVEDDHGVDVVVFEEERDAVCVMVTIGVRVPTVLVADVEPVLDDVALGKREVVADPDMVAETVSPVAEGEEEADTGERECWIEPDRREETDALLVRVGVCVPRIVTD